MPGYRESVFNVGGPESYVTGDDKLAAQHGDEMFRRMALQQQAAAMQAQLYDNAQNRTLQRDLTGTAQDRFGYDMKLQDARQSGDLALEDTRQGGMNTRTSMEMGPAMGQLGLAQEAWKAGQPQRDFNNKLTTTKSSFLDGVLPSGSGAGSAPPGTTPVAGGGGSFPEGLRNSIAASMLTGAPLDPDQDLKHSLLQMQIEEASRGKMKNRVAEYQNAGKYAEANTLAKANGIAYGMPADQAASQLDIAGMLQSLAGKENSITDTNSFRSLDKSPQYADFSSLIDQAANTMSSKYGVDPAQARAFIMEKVKALLPPDRTGMFRGEGTFVKDWGQSLRRLTGQQ
jgi:hypothetical protein